MPCASSKSPNENKKANAGTRTENSLRLLAGAYFHHLAGLERTGGDPHALHLAIGQHNAHALKIGLKFTLGDLDNVGTNAAAFLRLTLADDLAARNGVLAGDETDF